MPVYFYALDNLFISVKVGADCSINAAGIVLAPPRPNSTSGLTTTTILYTLHLNNDNGATTPLSPSSGPNILMPSSKPLLSIQNHRILLLQHTSETATPTPLPTTTPSTLHQNISLRPPPLQTPTRKRILQLPTHHPLCRPLPRPPPRLLPRRFDPRRARLRIPRCLGATLAARGV